MVAIALFVALACYASAAVLAAVPLARPMEPPVRRVVAVLSVVGLAHVGAVVPRVRYAGQLKSHRFGSVFRSFPLLESLDRVNHLSIIIGWVGLTSGIGLASGYSLVYGQADAPRVVWGIVAWLAASAVAAARLLGGWRARR